MVLYTPDADFDELTNRDPTTELIAYVDQIIDPSKVGSKGKTYDLFKFVLTNGNNRRVLCLIWGIDLIDKYQFEITIHRVTVVEYLGVHTLQPSRAEDKLTEVEFENIKEATGLISSDEC